ncbi:MAG TPA: endonuclease domain-containing protein [Stellaceae bacterium]|nr:endonuclease domain-containing protein [Stellaceae bacterium]
MTARVSNPLPRLRGRVRVGVSGSSRDNMRGGSETRDRARGLRRTMTDAERRLWRELRRAALGLRFRRQFPIPPYIVDFACLEARLVIEVDGGQHAEPGDHDRRDAILHRRGWRILRFWNNDVLENRDGVLQTTTHALGTWPAQYPHPNPPPPAGEGVRPSGDDR